MTVCVPAKRDCGIKVKLGEYAKNVNGSIRIKIRENCPYNIIKHTDVLKDMFPEENFTMY